MSDKTEVTSELEWFKREVDSLNEHIEGYKELLSRSRMANARLKRALFDIAESKQVGMDHDDCVNLAITTIQFTEI